MMAHLTDRLVTEGDLKEVLGIADADTTDDNRLTVAADAATQMIQAYCNRHFVQQGSVSARTLVASTPWMIEVDDISTATGLIIKTDEDADGTFETTWASTDYQLEPLNGKLGGQDWPYTRIRAIKAREFPFDYGQALVQVTARWGWANPADAALYIPQPVTEAALIQGVSVFKSAEAPLGIAGFGDIGIMRLRQAMHPVAMALLAPYRREQVQVA
jgi:hypothetical protein